MIDNIFIKRLWQDADFFEIEVECRNEFIIAREEVYTTNALIDDLCSKIDIFLSEKADTICWKNGTKGDWSTPCTMLTFFHKDNRGHVQIEVFMEINDGGSLNTHNCCFFVNTEIGLLQQFRENLLKLKTPQIGIEISLNTPKDSFP